MARRLRSFVRRAKWAMAVAALLSPVLITPATASSGTSYLAWSVPTPVDTFSGGLHSVSCPSVSFCVTIDVTGNA